MKNLNLASEKSAMKKTRNNIERQFVRINCLVGVMNELRQSFTKFRWIYSGLLKLKRHQNKSMNNFIYQNLKRLHTRKKWW